jgi:hypothetical protein
MNIYLMIEREKQEVIDFLHHLAYQSKNSLSKMLLIKNWSNEDYLIAESIT